MKRMANLTLAASCLFFAAGKTEALTVLPQQESAGSRMGKAFAEGMQRGIEEGWRAQAERDRADAPRKEAERRRQLANDFITYYEPENHHRCVAMILESELSRETKDWIIAHVNKIREAWLAQKEFEKEH